MEYFEYVGNHPSSVSLFGIRWEDVTAGLQLFGKIDFTWTDVPVSIEIEPRVEIPEILTLHQNYPNPFNPVTVISFEISRDSQIRLDMYTVDGRHVTEITNGYFVAGTHRVTVNAQALSSGVYLYRIKAGDQWQTGKMTLIK